MRLTPAAGIKAQKAKAGRVPLLILRPEKPKGNSTGILWIHGGGYILGLKEMVHMSRASDLVLKYGVTVISPGYRLAWRKPYPAAAEDCYAALEYLYAHADALGVRRDRIAVGGESAGGGLAAAVCMMARDRGEVSVAFQMPLYPMLSSSDTETSKDNHGRVWNTRRNHIGWRAYLRGDAKAEVSPYASPICQTDFSGLPPAYTFVGDGEPFYAETLEYVRKLKEAGVPAEADVYHTDIHAFDMLFPKKSISREAARRFEERFEYALEHYLSAQDR
ncbi:MAG: alpha/beta hydrolase [Clostridiales bacterium]|nr:alpha/beta hydrolase [Clostridiales bacterium]